MTQDDALDVLVAFALHAPKLLTEVLDGHPDEDVRELNIMVLNKIQERARQAAIMGNAAKDWTHEGGRKAAEVVTARASAKAEREGMAYEAMLRARLASHEPTGDELN